jgi:hypothetical protein
MSGWTNTPLGGRAAHVFDPPGGRPRGAVLWLHDLDEITPHADPVLTPLFAAAGLAVAAPLGGVSWWADKPCPEFDPAVTPEAHLRDAVLPAIRERWGVRPVAAAGVGAGGHAALRLAFRFPLDFPVVAAVDPAIDWHDAHGHGTPLDAMYPTPEHCRQDSAILHLHPGAVPPHVWLASGPDSYWWRGCDRLCEKLRASGVTYEADLAAPGPRPAAVAAALVQFVAAALEREGRRLF